MSFRSLFQDVTDAMDNVHQSVSGPGPQSRLGFHPSSNWGWWSGIAILGPLGTHGHPALLPPAGLSQGEDPGELGEVCGEGCEWPQTRVLTKPVPLLPAPPGQGVLLPWPSLLPPDRALCPGLAHGSPAWLGSPCLGSLDLRRGSQDSSGRPHPWRPSSFLQGNPHPAGQDEGGWESVPGHQQQLQLH